MVTSHGVLIVKSASGDLSVSVFNLHLFFKLLALSVELSGHTPSAHDCAFEGLFGLILLLPLFLVL